MIPLRNILIFHQAALGDFIVTWPLALALSRIYPQSRVIYVTHSQKGKLAERVLRVEWADCEAGWHGLFQTDMPQLSEQAGRLFGAAHTIVSFTGPDPRSFAAVAPQAQIIELDTKKPGRGHVTDSLVNQLADRPALASALQQMLELICSVGLGFRLIPQDRVVIHPGAGKQTHLWPAENYLELIRSLSRSGRKVRVLLGEAELERWPGELIARFCAEAEVRQPATLLELLDEIVAASVFIGNDSGPGHLAGIVGVPTISLMRNPPENQPDWRPLGPDVSVIRADCLQAINPQDVYTHVMNLTGS